MHSTKKCLPAFIGALLSAASVMPIAALAEAQYPTLPPVEIRLASGSLADVITELSIQTQVQILVPGGLVKGEPAPALSGNYTAEQALLELVKNTGLVVLRSGPRALTLALADPEQSYRQLPKIVEEVMVFGQKIERSLQDTPTSVAVINQSQMEDKNLINFEDTLNETANAHTPPYGRGFSIRGIDAFDVSGSGDSSLASVYVDGAALPKFMITGGGFSTWDAQQVEILRGPQSTLQGRNALAGAVVVTSNRPSHDFGGSYRATVGEYETSNVAATIGGGVIDDQLAVSVSYERNAFGGVNKNVTRGEPSDYRDDDLLRLKLLYEPSGIPGLSALFTYMRAENNRGRSLVPRAPDGIDQFSYRRSFNNDKQEQFFDGDFSSLLLEYELNDHWDFTSVSTYSEFTDGFIWDDDHSAEPVGVRYNDASDDAISQELRVNFNYDRWQGVMGLYYSKAEATSGGQGISSLSLASVGINTPALMAAYGLDQATADFVIDQYADFDPARTSQTYGYTADTKSYALFSDMTVQLTDHWELMAGVRLDRERKEDSDFTSLFITNSDQLPDPANYPAPLNQLIGGINALTDQLASGANRVNPPNDASFDTVLPKLGISYHWHEDLSTSFIVQRGYRSGGVGVNAARGTVHEYDAEYTTNYELALRSVWLDGDLVVNANAFFVDWQDQQVAVQLSANTFDGETRNAGSSEVKGYELDVNYQLSDAVNLYVSVGRAETEFADFVIEIPTNSGPVINDLTGRSFADAPEWTGNLGATFRHHSGVFANASVNYSGGSNYYVDPYTEGAQPGDPGFDPQNDSRTLLNIQLGYEWDQFGVYLVGKNLTDEEYMNGRGSSFVLLGKPRILSLNVRGYF